METQVNVGQRPTSICGEYGKRWAVETYFSAAKRLLGEYVTAKRPENAMKEVKLKFLLYTTLNKMDVGLRPTSICGA